MLFSQIIKENYRNIKEAETEELKTAIDNVITVKKLDKVKRASNISDDKFREAVQLIKDAVKNKFTEKEIKDALARELLSRLPESEKFKESGDWNTYEVIVDYCGFGLDHEYLISACNKADAVNYALDEPGSEAEQDLSIENIEDNGDGSYDVEVGFAGYIGASENYTVYADDEEDAEIRALEDAKENLEVVSVDGKEFDYSDESNFTESTKTKKHHKLTESDKPFNSVMERWYDRDVDILPTQYAESYHDVLKSIQEVKEYNYHSDYWGDAEEYQENAEELMLDIEPFIGQDVDYDTDDGTIKIKVLGVDVDRQYNGHLAVRVDILEEPIKEAETSKITADDFLESTITIYDIANLVESLDLDSGKEDDHTEYTTHTGPQRALLQDVNGKYILADYEAIRDLADSEEDTIAISVSAKPSKDENGHMTFPIFPSGTINLPVKLIKTAPSKQMKAKDFFEKYNYNDRCARNFSGLIENLNGIYR